MASKSNGKRKLQNKSLSDVPLSALGNVRQGPLGDLQFVSSACGPEVKLIHCVV